MIIVIHFGQKDRNFQMHLFEEEVERYGSTNITQYNIDDEGMASGVMMLAFGGSDFSKLREVFADWRKKFGYGVQFICYRVSEAFVSEYQGEEYEWIKDYMNSNIC